MTHKVSIENLYHFNCMKCQGWWSIADYPKTVKDDDDFNWITCPHCATTSDFVENEE